MNDRLFVLCVLVMGSLGACAGPAPEDGKAEPAERARAASAATPWVAPEPASALSWMQAPGRVIADPRSVAVVSAPHVLRVLRVRVRAGQRVEAGDPLADVLMPDLIRAVGELASAELRRDALLKRKSRLEPLVDQQLARAVELADLEASLAIAQAEAESARASLRAAGLGDAAARRLGKGDGSLTLRSPIAGLVAEVAARMGETRAPGDPPLFSLMAESEVRVEAQFSGLPPESVRYAWVTPGLRLALRLEAVAPQAGAQGMRTLWLSFDDSADQAALPVAGTLGTVEVEGPAEWRSVPAAAVGQGQASAFVVVHEDGGPKARPVQVVWRSTAQALVTGLSADDRVAAEVRAIEGDLR